MFFTLLALSSLNLWAPCAALAAKQEYMAERTFNSHKFYADPFNDVDVDVVFSRDEQSWRVPAFWRGSNQWTVRFSPPVPGDYVYRLESTDKNNPDLNGPRGYVTITAYSGSNPLLKHGMLRVSTNKRYFEHTDGTPFYWLGDTLWTGLSDRMSWRDFQRFVADRQKKGFSVTQLCAGLVPNNEELAPVDPGYRNEGGAVWDPSFSRINPKYFDYADRRIKRLIEAGIVPAIVGGWQQVLQQMGSAKMKQHWRYIIARYGAYPVFWVVGGELFDPPESVVTQLPKGFQSWLSPGWTDIARYVRATDPYHHPLAAHEAFAPFDVPLQDETLTDFDLIQPHHFGWASIAAEVSQLNTRYARTDMTKPVVVGEIGYEMLGGIQLEDFQRVAFWMAMLNGAAGHTYGAAPVFEVNSSDKPLHRYNQFGFLNWKEGINLPGSSAVGLGANLLRQYRWWQIAPHPEWITPRGTTLLDPHRGPIPFDSAQLSPAFTEDGAPTDLLMESPETVFPIGEWQTIRGSFRRPYAGGIPGKLRVVYIPYLGLYAPPPPTVLGLERGVRYQAFYWEPMQGIKFDLGTVELPAPGAIVLKDDFNSVERQKWSEHGPSKARRDGGKLVSIASTMSIIDKNEAQDVVVGTDIYSDSSAGIVLRYRDNDNYVAAIYSATEKALYLLTRVNGVNSLHLGSVPVSALGSAARLSAEVRAGFGQVSVTDSRATYSTPITDILGDSAYPPVAPDTIQPGSVGLMHPDDGGTQKFDNFELRQSPVIAKNGHLSRKLYDAHGTYRGEISGPSWDEFGKSKNILLDSYRPERFPAKQDWVLLLESRDRGAADSRYNESQ